MNLDLQLLNLARSNENYSIPKSLAPLPEDKKRKTDEVDAFVINKKKKAEAPKEDEWADLPQVNSMTSPGKIRGLRLITSDNLLI